MKKIQLTDGKFYIVELLSGGIQLLDGDKNIIDVMNCEEISKGFIMNILEHKIMEVEELIKFFEWFINNKTKENSMLIHHTYEKITAVFNCVMNTNYTMNELMPYINRIGCYYFILNINFVKQNIEFLKEEA